MQALFLLAILAADDRVHLRIESVPAGASVMVGTREVGLTPLTVEVPRGRQVAVSASSGGQRAFRWVTPTRDSTIWLLVPLPSRALRNTLGAVLSAAVDITEDRAGWEFDAETRRVDGQRPGLRHHPRGLLVGGPLAVRLLRLPGRAAVPRPTRKLISRGKPTTRGHASEHDGFRRGYRDRWK